MGDNYDFSIKLDESPSTMDNTLLNSEENLENLKERTTFYHEENKKMEATIAKMNLNDIKEECDDVLDKLSELQLKFNTKELSVEAISLSYSQKLRKRDRYAANMKLYIKMYITLNDKLTKDIKSMKTALEQSKSQLNNIVGMSKDQIKIMEDKIQRYENDFIKIGTKYPWLRDGQYDFNNISKEIGILNSLCEKKTQLVKELDVYSGLKPDLSEASRQIEQIKNEYDTLNRQVMSSAI